MISAIAASKDPLELANAIRQIYKYSFSKPLTKYEMPLSTLLRFSEALDHLDNAADINLLMGCWVHLPFRPNNVMHLDVLSKMLTKLLTYEMTAKITSTTMDTLGKLGKELSWFRDDQRAALLAVIAMTADAQTPRDMTQVLRGLTGTGCKWASLPPEVQDGLWRSVERNSLIMQEPLTATTVLLSLGELAYPDAANKLQLLLMVAEKAIIKEGGKNTAEQVATYTSQALLGLGNMGIPFTSIPQPLQEHIHNCLKVSWKTMTIPETSQSFYGLGLMRWPWSALSPVLKGIARSAINNGLRHEVPRHGHLLVNGLANMGMRLEDFPAQAERVQAMVSTKAIARNISRGLALETLPISFHAMVSMGIKWEHISLTFQSDLIEAYALIQDKLSAQHCIMFLEAFMLADMPSEGRTVFLKALDRTVERLEPSVPLFQVLLKLTAWEQLSVLAGKMTAEERSACILSLSTLPDLPMDSICFAVEAFAPHLNEDELATYMTCTVTMLSGPDSSKTTADARWRMITALVQRYAQVAHNKSSVPFCVFFDFLSALPGGEELITTKLGNKPKFTKATAVTAAKKLKELQQRQPAE